MPQTFDPLKEGATALSTFDPLKEGATSFDPLKEGASKIDVEPMVAHTQVGPRQPGQVTTAEQTPQFSTFMSRLQSGLSGLGILEPYQNLLDEFKKRWIEDPTAWKDWWNSTGPFTDRPEEHGIQPLINTVKGMIQAPGEGYQEIKQGVKESNPNKTMHGIGKFTSAVIPFTEGISAGGEALAKASAEKPFLFKTPEMHLRKALGGAIDDANLKLGGGMLKAGEAKTGVPITNTDSALAASKAQFEQELMPTRRDIIDPQKDVEVKGSAQELIDSRLAAINKLRNTMTPREYVRAVADVKSMSPKDLTIGELEQLNSNYNSSNATYHRSTLSQGLTKEQVLSNAMDIASEPVTRSLMEKGMETYGKGGYQDLKLVNKRIGALIKTEDSLAKSSPLARMQESDTRLGHLIGGPKISEGLSGRAFARATINTEPTINGSLEKAMRNWKDVPTPVQPNLRPRFGPAPGQTIPLGPAPDTSGPIPMTRVTNRLNAAPDTSAVTSPPVVNAPFPQAQIPATTGGPHAMPEVPVPPEHTAGPPIQTLEGPFKNRPIVGEQQDLGGLPKRVVPGERQPANPKQGQLFTERQTTPEAISAQKNTPVPKGTKLAFTSNVKGSTLYHYQTPDGVMITSEEPLDIEGEAKVQARQIKAKPTPPPQRNK